MNMKTCNLGGQSGSTNSVRDGRDAESGVKICFLRQTSNGNNLELEGPGFTGFKRPVLPPDRDGCFGGLLPGYCEGINPCWNPTPISLGIIELEGTSRQIFYGCAKRTEDSNLRCAVNTSHPQIGSVCPRFPTHAFDSDFPEQGIFQVIYS